MRADQRPSRRPSSRLPIDSGSASMSAIVSTTASRTVAGSALRSFFARRVSRSSGKPELAPHLFKREQPAGPHVFLALAERRQRLLVLQDLQRLLDGFPLLW